MCGIDVQCKSQPVPSTKFRTMVEVMKSDSPYSPMLFCTMLSHDLVPLPELYHSPIMINRNIRLVVKMRIKWLNEPAFFTVDCTDLCS